MQLDRTQIAEGVYFNRLTDDRFKKQRLNVLLVLPLKREMITGSALLPYLLERSTLECPTPASLQRKLMSLYGASYSCNSNKTLGRSYVSASLEGPRGCFLPEKDIEREYIRFISSCVFSPDMPNGSFSPDAVEIEKQKLEQLIASQYNDKRYFCQKNVMSAFYSNDPRGLDSCGYAEDLPELDSLRLSELYRRFSGQGTIEIFAINSGNAGDFKSLISPRRVEEPAALPAIPYAEQPDFIDIPDSVEQDAVAMMFTGGRLLNRRERAALRVGCAAFGGTPTSRLFMNVREKQSLCYYCSATPDLMNSAIIVTTGVAHKNVERARESILHELSELCRGVTQKELTEAKLLLKNAFLELDDNVGALCGWYTGNILAGLPPYSPAEELEILQAITADEVTEIMSLFRLHTVCRVGKDNDAK